MMWLIRLRWIAAVGVFCALIFVKNYLKFSLPYNVLYSIAGILLIYNGIFYYSVHKFKELLRDYKYANFFAHLQISLDLLSLALLIHFSGGIENPFIFYFIFHMIIASILLSRKASFLQATYAVFLFVFIVLSEYKGFLPHYCLDTFVLSSLHDNVLYVSGIFFVFLTTVYFAVYMATTISATLKEREKNLQEVNLQLQEKDQIKSEYVLRVSHDIKESLAAVQSCIEPVTEKIVGSLNEVQNNLLSTAVGRTQRLIFFVNALLDITRLKLTKKLQMGYFSLADMIHNLSKDIVARAQSKGISFIVHMDSTIGTFKGFKVYIEEAIMNLLANSLKYTPRGGKITLSVNDMSTYIRIIINDTGIGIPADEMPHIFEEFYRAKNVRKIEKQGTGLGLSVTKEIIEKHHGKIRVVSEEHKGTTFEIELPK